MSESRIASALFGGEPELPEASGDPAADALYVLPTHRQAAEAAEAEIAAQDYIGETPEEVVRQRAHREASARSFDNVNIERALSLEIAPAVQRAIGTQVRELAADVGMDRDELDLAVGAVGAVSRMDEGQIADMHEQAIAALKERHGEHAHERLQLARRMVAANPQLVRVLDQTKLGSHPRTVLALVDAAVRLQRAGRLR